MTIFKEKDIVHLDLHGIKHQDVDIEVRDFIFQYQGLLPLIIICGNSNKMVELVSQTLKMNDVVFSSPRFGVMRIEGI
tara:strand:- start:575 stop:808 length:234 start_codon:yes stop_codon:yes gene_type:complete